MMEQNNKIKRSKFIIILFIFFFSCFSTQVKKENSITPITKVLLEKDSFVGTWRAYNGEAGFPNVIPKIHITENGEVQRSGAKGIKVNYGYCTIHPELKQIEFTEDDTYSCDERALIPCGLYQADLTIETEFNLKCCKLTHSETKMTIKLVKVEE